MVTHPRDSEPVEVLVAGRRVLRRPGLIVHYTHAVQPDEVTARHGMPITTPARTLYDLAGGARQRMLESALAAAEVQRLVVRNDLIAYMNAHTGRAGERRLRALLDADTAAGITRSKAEELFLELIRRAGLPDPATNARLQGFEVDCFWPTERLVVEVDGRAFHSTQRRFESDRRKEAVLVASGFRVIHVTWKQIVNTPEALVASIAQALARSPRP